MAAFPIWTPSDDTLLWGVNVLLQLTLIVATALIVASLLKRRPVARYWILCASLFWVLFTPMVALVAPAAGWSIFSASLVDKQPTEADGETATGKPATPKVDLGEHAVRAELRPVGNSQGQILPSSPGASLSSSLASDTGQQVASTPMAAMASPASSAPTLATTRPGVWLRLWMPPVLLAWAVGTALFLGRIAIGWCRLISLLRSARLALCESMAIALDEARRSLGTETKPFVAFSRRVSSPFATGLWRPYVVLPEGLLDRITAEQLRDILVHELAHIHRRDHVIVLLQNLAAAVFWIHPLIRLMNAHLARAREETCDNHVLKVTDGRSYCHTLLTLAELSQPMRLLPGSVGLLTSRWKLETRIAGILDDRRNPMTQLSAFGKAMVISMSLAVGSIAGLATVTIAVGQDDRGNGSASDAISVRETSSSQSADAKQTENAGPSDRLELAGMVVDSASQPVAGANVYLLQESPMVTDPVAVVQTNADGGFEFDVSKNVFDVAETSEPWLIAKVLAKADGFGPAWALAASFESSGKMAKNLPLYPNLTDRRAELVADQTLRLVTDDVPIEGRIVSIEGQPIAGARVRVMEINRTGQPTFDSWLTAAEDQLTAFEKAGNKLRVSTGFDLRRQIERLFSDIKSDKDGRFRIVGVGRESIVGLQIEGPGIETCQISARTRKGETIRVADRRFQNEQAKITYGSNFDHVAGPSRPVKGVVRDKDTRQPLFGVKVQAYRLAGVGVQPYPNAMFYTLTDTQGRYQLDGLPVGGNKLLAIGPASEPYIVSALPAEIAPDRTETTVDFALKRGVWIRGRVTDASDGRPLRSNVYYDVFDDNVRRREAPGYSDAFSLWYLTDADGRFQLPGFVGRGIVGVRATNYSDYPKGVGADRIEGRETNNGYTGFRAEHFGWAENYHAVAAVTPDENGANNECNFALVPGRKISGKLLDSAGEPLTGAMIAGAAVSYVWQPLENATFTVHNVDPLKPRRVQFRHSERKLAGSVTVTGDEAGPINVKLEPWATITGRIVDTVGDPLHGARLVSDEGDKQQLGALPGYEFSVDAEGRFKIEGLAPRLPYNLTVLVPQGSLGTVVKDLQLSPGETKDLGDLSVKRPSS